MTILLILLRSLLWMKKGFYGPFTRAIKIIAVTRILSGTNIFLLNQIIEKLDNSSMKRKKVRFMLNSYFIGH